MKYKPFTTEGTELHRGNFTEEILKIWDRGIASHAGTDTERVVKDAALRLGYTAG